MDSIFDIEFSPHKALVHWDRLRDLADGKDTAPVTLELDISSTCNHRCHWCVDPPGTHSGHFMPLAVAEKIMTEARQLGVRGIVFKGGGESTLHPGFPLILQRAAEIGFEIGVVTHGGNLDKDSLIQGIGRHCAYVRISIDGPNAESRRKVHGVDDFSALTPGITRLMSARGGKRHPVVGATFCLDYDRRKEANDCIRLGEELQLDYVLIRPPFCEEVGFPAPYTAQQATELRGSIREAALRYQGELPVMTGDWVGDKEMETIPPDKKNGRMARRDSAMRSVQYNGFEHETRRCPASPLFLVITAEGDVYGCCCLRGIKHYSFGRIDYEKGISLMNIMKGKERAERLREMKNTECLAYCTHPMEKINRLLEYLSLPEKHHSSFL